MTERAQTKKAQVGKRFHERMGDYNNDGVRANNEGDKSGNDKIKRPERALFRPRGYLIVWIVCAAETTPPLITHDEVEPVGEPTAFLNVGTF